MKLRLTFCLFFTFLTAFLYAQNTNCNIIITDSLTNERLPFANIYLKKSGQGTSTDLTGSAKLKVPVSVLEDILVISYVGYHTKEVPYQNNQQTFSIQLRARSQSLGEVVVTDKKLLKPKSNKDIIQNYHIS